MNQIVHIETDKDVYINQILGLTTDNPIDQMDNKAKNTKSTLDFGKILRFQAIFGSTYGGSVYHFNNSQSNLKLKRSLLILYELIIIVMMSVYYLYFVNENDQIFEMNTKKPVMKMMMKIAVHSYIITFVVFKLVLLINGRSILKTIETFKEKQSNIETQVISIESIEIHCNYIKQLFNRLSLRL